MHTLENIVYALYTCSTPVCITSIYITLVYITPIYSTRYDIRIYSLIVYNGYKRMLVSKGYCTADISIFFGFCFDIVSLSYKTSDRLSFRLSVNYRPLFLMRLHFSGEFSEESNYIRSCILSLSLYIYVLFFILSAYRSESILAIFL